MENLMDYFLLQCYVNEGKVIREYQKIKVSNRISS